MIALSEQIASARRWASLLAAEQDLDDATTRRLQRALLCWQGAHPFTAIHRGIGDRVLAQIRAAGPEMQQRAHGGLGEVPRSEEA